MSDAQHYGYHVPPTASARAGAVGSSAQPTGQVSVATAAALDGADGCRARAEHALLGHSPRRTPFDLADRLRTRAWLESLHHPEVRAATGDWVNCMASHGYVLDGPLDPSLPSADAPTVTRAEVDEAATDVRCKKATDLIRRWNSVENVIAAELAEGHATALHRSLVHLKGAVHRARLVLRRSGTISSTHGER